MNAPLPIEIVGGGLAGLSLGLALRRRGIPVTILEAGDYPRHRVCGEFIAGLDEKTIGQLRLAPLLAGALRHTRVAWFTGDRLRGESVLPRPALGISRHALDVRLAQEFVRAGGRLCTGTRIASAEPRSGRVLALGRRKAVHGGWLGLKVHARGLALHADLEVHLGDHAYVGLCRVDPETVNVCGLFRTLPGGSESVRSQRGAPLVGYARRSGMEGLATRLQAAEIEPGSACAVAAVGFDRRVRSTNGLYVGDASAMIPPFTGNGMAMAFQSAAEAEAPLAAYAMGEIRWPTATAAVCRALRARFRTRLRSAGLLHPFLLRPTQQRWFTALQQARLLPFRSLYGMLH